MTNLATNPEFSTVLVVKKKWGGERVSVNTSSGNYCGKVLFYDKAGAKSSFHFHPLHKDETFTCVKGSFYFRYLDGETGQKQQRVLKVNDVVRLRRGIPHQLEALEDNSEIFEVSTYDDPSDIIRIEPGDNQK